MALKDSFYIAYEISRTSIVILFNVEAQITKNLTLEGVLDQHLLLWEVLRGSSHAETCRGTVMHEV